MSGTLPHTERIRRLLDEGHTEEARRLHNEFVAQQMRRAQEAPINLSDLLAAREELHIDAIGGEGDD